MAAAKAGLAELAPARGGAAIGAEDLGAISSTPSCL
jgi:hypothetical protein